MCDALAVGIGMQAAGTVMGAASAIQRGNYNKAIAGMNADAANRAAADAVQSGHLEELRAEMRGDVVSAEARVGGSGSGADINAGGSAASQRGTQAIARLDALAAQRRAALQAYGLRDHARAYFQEGAYAQKEGESEALGTFLSGMGGLASDIPGSMGEKDSPVSLVRTSGNLPNLADPRKGPDLDTGAAIFGGF